MTSAPVNAAIGELAVARSSSIHPAVLDADDAPIGDVGGRSRRSSRDSRGDRALARLLRECEHD